MPALTPSWASAISSRDLAILFLTTASPKPSENNTRRIRTAVTNQIVAAIQDK